MRPRVALVTWSLNPVGRLLDMRGDLERRFPAADVFLLPTLYEHGSRASHEAAACGLPLGVCGSRGDGERRWRGSRTLNRA